MSDGRLVVGDRVLVIARCAPAFRAGTIVEVIEDRAVKVAHEGFAFAKNREFVWLWSEVMCYDGIDVFDECTCGNIDCAHPQHVRRLREVGTQDVLVYMAGARDLRYT